MKGNQFRVIRPDEVRPGDLLLVTQIPDEPLGRLMEELDGTCFSHSGIAIPCVHGSKCSACRPRIASSQIAPLPNATDWGGIRCDDFDHFWPSRDLYAVAMTDEYRERALAKVSQFDDTAGEDGRFAITKLVAIAVALHATKLQRSPETRDLGRRMFRAARDVAEAWRATPESPRYYCAEFVAEAYRRPFVRPELDPREQDPEASDVARRGHLPSLAELRQAVRDLLFDELAPTGEQRRARHRMLSLLAWEDPTFLWRAVTTVLDAAVFAQNDDGDPPTPPPAPAIPSPLDPALTADPDEWGEEIPFALVTPRMLWAAFGREKLSRVEQP